MDNLREETAQLIESLTELKHALKASNARGSSNTSNIKVEAGGVGPWLATALCLVMFGMFLTLCFWIVSEKRTMRDEMRALETKMETKDQQHDDYLAAIYMLAPELKPKEKDAK